MSGRWAAALTALTGLATLAVSLAFQQLSEVVAAARCEVSGLMLPFEFARTHAELTTLFGAYGGDCHQMRIDAMNASNHLDIRLYIPLYGAFCVFAAWFFAGRAGAPLAIAAICAALVAAWADLFETTALLELAHRLNGPTGAEASGAIEAQLPLLTAASRLKFALLGAHGLLLAAIGFTAARKRRIAGGLALLAAPATAVLLFSAPDNAQAHQIYIAGMIAAWLPIVLVAAKETFAPPRAAAG